MPFPSTPSDDGRYPIARDQDGERVDIAAYFPGAAADVNAPAANTAAVVQYAADEDAVHVLTQATFSYDIAPAAGSYLQVALGTAVVFRAYISQAGPGPITFVAPICGVQNQAMIITLTAGGAGIAGSLSCRH